MKYSGPCPLRKATNTITDLSIKKSNKYNDWLEKNMMFPWGLSLPKTNSVTSFWVVNKVHQMLMTWFRYKNKQSNICFSYCIMHMTTQTNYFPEKEQLHYASPLSYQFQFNLTILICATIKLALKRVLNFIFYNCSTRYLSPRTSILSTDAYHLPPAIAIGTK